MVGVAPEKTQRAPLFVAGPGRCECLDSSPFFLFQAACPIGRWWWVQIQPCGGKSIRVSFPKRTSTHTIIHTALRTSPYSTYRYLLLLLHIPSLTFCRPTFALLHCSSVLPKPPLFPIAERSLDRQTRYTVPPPWLPSAALCTTSDTSPALLHRASCKLFFHTRRGCVCIRAADSRRLACFNAGRQSKVLQDLLLQ